MNENGPKFNHQDAAHPAASQESPRGLAELQPIPPQNLANLQPASNLSELTSANPLTDMQSGGAHLPPLAAQVSTVPQPHQSLPATDSQHQSSVSHPNPALLQSHPVLASQQLQAAQQLQTLQSGPPQNTLSQSYSVNHQQHASPIQQHQAVLQQQHNSQLQRQQQPHSAVGHQQPGMIPNHVPKVEPDVKTEPGPLPSDPTMQVILAYLRKQNLGDTEMMLKEELKKREVASAVAPPPSTAAADPEVGNVLASYKSDGDPSSYISAYNDLEKFIDNSMDMYKHELALILYPVFVHMYLELVYNQHEAEGRLFMQRFGNTQESYYQEDIRKLSFVTKKEHMKGNELMENFNTSQFTVRMSRDTYTQLRQQKKYLSEKQHSLLWNVIQEHLYLDVYEGLPRSKSQIDSTAGAMTGEANRQANRAKVYYGLLREPDVMPLPQEEEEEPEMMDGDKPKKKKKKENIMQKKSKSDPNAPILTRMPFPELRDSDKIEKARAFRESMKRANLGPDNIPSICMYTLMNVSCQVNVVGVSEDSSMLAAGLSDSKVRVWSLLNHKLKKLKPAELLNDINREAEDVLHRIMDDSTAETSKELIGHSGPVYGVSFSPDKSMLLSGSEDGSVRLWSLQTWTCLVVYKGHVYPVWDVQFSPQGYYFASCGHDRTARLWTTEQAQPLRIFQGHFSDVDCLAFHPNSNYIGTGSSDRSLRLWDCLTGACVRFMTGHKSAVLCLSFSPDGRFLASGSSDQRVLVWDLAFGHLLAELAHHSSIISTLSFSREGTILTSAAIDCSIALWDFTKMTCESSLEEVNVTHNPDVRRDVQNLLLGTYRTKSTSLLHLHYTRRNLLLAVGPFSSL